MIKRATWFVSGAVAGAAGVSYAKRTVKRRAAQLAPAHVARTIGRRVRQRAHDLGEAVRDGRAAMRAKEAELRAQRENDLASEIAVVEGDLAGEPGQVILLRAIASEPSTQNHPAMRHARRQHRRRSH